MRSNIRFLLAGLLLFFVFVVFSYFVHKDKFTKFDFDTTVRLQNNIPRRADNIFSLFSEVGKFEVMIIFLIIIFIVIRKFLAGIFALILFTGFHFFELFGKYFVNHPPPPQFLLRTKDIIDFPQFYVRTDNSYPSGHAGRTTFISIILFFLIWRSKSLNTQMKILLVSGVLMFDLIMFISRIYLGEHWTSDVFGGALLGMSLGLISCTIIVFQNKKAIVKKI